MLETLQARLVETRVAPAAVRRLDDGMLFVAFPRAAFGTLTVAMEPQAQAVTLTVHLGEKLDARGRLDRQPPGTIRYRCVRQTVAPGEAACRLLIPPDARNTGPAAIRMPEPIGVVMPYRYVEIESADGIDPAGIRQVAVHYPFDDEAADFACDNETLKAVWDLCKYTIKATTFCGVYVDGDRERIPYEGDAYISQLGHYGVDHEYDFARTSTAYMIAHPTWCTEWHLHSVMMAWMDYLYTGQREALEPHYEALCAKTLIDFAREDGLISVDPSLRTPEMEARLEPHFARGVIKRDIRDVVDWPPGSFTDGGTGERDNHEMRPVNTVVNAFHAHALRLMARIAGVLGYDADQRRFAGQAERVVTAINAQLFDAGRGVYIDGEGSSHASLHSNMFMLAFDLVPGKCKLSVVAFVKSRGMACSVYGAQHLLDALYLNGEADHALDLMTARHDRSWWNMIQAGSTMTLEAWDWRYKNNLDWNHAWGAAPANIIPRYVLGVRPIAPGFSEILIQPQPGSLTWARGRVPTNRGPVDVEIRNEPGLPFELRFSLPEGIRARVGIPSRDSVSCDFILDGQRMSAEVDGRCLCVCVANPGNHTLMRM